MNIAKQLADALTAVLPLAAAEVHTMKAILQLGDSVTASQKAHQKVEDARAALRDYIAKKGAEDATIANLRGALEEIKKGSEASGRWLDESGQCQEFDEGAEWAEYTPEEQAEWLGTVVEICDKALSNS